MRGVRCEACSHTQCGIVQDVERRRHVSARRELRGEAEEEVDGAGGSGHARAARGGSLFARSKNREGGYIFDGKACCKRVEIQSFQERFLFLFCISVFSVAVNVRWPHLNVTPLIYI